MSTFKDITGKKFGRLIVVEYIGGSKWLCKCKCEKFTVVRTCHLNSRSIRSCGCLHRELVGKQSKTHGRTDTPEYKIWAGMLQRCNNKNTEYYKCYGGRGIRVCKRWHKFEEFLKDMGERPAKNMTLERKDNDKGYFPKNCMWATPKQQGRNKRNNRMYIYKGETRCLSEWCEIFGLNYNSIRIRLIRGWTFYRAITESKKVNQYG